MLANEENTSYGESLQEYASEIEWLTNFSFSDYPANVLEIIFRERTERWRNPEGLAENRKFRFGLIDYPDPDSSKASVLIAEDISKSVVPVRVASISDKTRTIQEGEVIAVCAPVTF
ncbi:hypothetical protein TNCV_3226261 [Trichonephila clavipes]|nr:hypothetical protein TNCV_3226261 [Trichonephila clavipes]